VAASFGVGQGSYKQPPKEIMDVLNTPAIPTTSISPARDKIALLVPLRYPPISDLAQPMLRLAGTRVNPNTNGPHLQFYAVSLRFKNVADGKEIDVALPPNAKVTGLQWSPDGKHAAFGNVTGSGVELWIADTATGKANRVKNVFVNTAFGGFGWENSNELSASLVPAGRGAAPQFQNLTPNEPNIQETTGRRGAIATFQDLLKTPNDEKLYEYYATSQLALIDVSGKVRNIGPPAIFADASFSPDGKYVYVSRVQRPYSYQVPANRFPKQVEVWDASGKVVQKFADVPLQESIPSGGVQTGPRQVGWIPVEPSTLIWTEALDGGDPRTKAAFPRQGDEIACTFQRFADRNAADPKQVSGPLLWRTRRVDVLLRFQPRYTKAPDVRHRLPQSFGLKGRLRSQYQRPLQRYRYAGNKAASEWRYGCSSKRRRDLPIRQWSIASRRPAIPQANEFENAED
jgi:dipeptidyl aminopeptidase/acylaminoacyl peptidase